MSTMTAVAVPVKREGGSLWSDAWRRLIARDPLNEAAYRKLMRCHERLGERREAVRLYERLTAVLRDELDSEPEPETQRLFERIQGGVVV